MNPVLAPSIPDSHVTFAKAVAALADEHKIERFALTYTPPFHGLRDMSNGQYVRGDLRINYASTDGRGRPTRNLAITLEAVLVHNIEKNPES